MTTTEREAVSVVVPAYQEAGSIAAALTRLAEVLDASGREYEIIVVSDGSSDGTADRARALALPHTTVLEYFPNRGKGHALRYGFARATNPLVAFLDGDLDLHPQVLPGYFDRLDAEEADVVVGSKVHPGSAVTYPFVRRVASRTFRMLTRVMLGVDLGDTQTGVKAMRRSVAAPVMENLSVTGFAFDLEMMCWLVERGARVQEAPVVLDYEFTSRIGATSMFEALRDVRVVAANRRERLRTPVVALPNKRPVPASVPTARAALATSSLTAAVAASSTARPIGATVPAQPFGEMQPAAALR